MNYIQQVKQDSIKEFGSEVTQEKYKKIAEQDFWQSEKILVNKYFKPKSNILDIGCGSGRTTIPLHRRGYKVIGIDITPQMIETACHVANANNLDIDYRIGDATKLEFSDDTFHGAIFANNGWAQIPGKDNRQKALNEIYRVLKPGGTFILTAHKRYFSLYYFYFWAIKWIKYYILKPLGVKIEEVDYGDIFFKRVHQNKRLKQRQFIHMAGKGEIERQINTAGFILLQANSMSKIAESDAKLMKGSLSANYNSYKSPVFYICQK